MFGHHYQNRDEDVAGRRKGSPEPLGSFARALLAELLNRSVAVEIAFRRVYETHGTAIPGDHDEALQDLARVVDTYLEDVEEARVRGLRARLFCRAGGTGNVNSEGIDDQDNLKDLGGELVPANRAAEEM